jgi:hypothetical protein
MSDGFDRRQKGFESKYQRDQEHEFRAQARRDKLFGLWLAEQFGITGDSAVSYAADVVESNFEKPGDEDMLDKVRADIKEKGSELTNENLILKLNELYSVADKQIEQGI